MDEHKEEVCLCIHGHFYQPPRENAWIESVERQESAFPYHDWNERILHECYFPNTRARVLNSEGKIEDIVNNYRKISFNFGPTLLSWMEKRDPETYESILHADKLSIEDSGGHGNAIAQVYNHMIMPLANRRDKVTQTRWGLADFRFRFGREAESIWLSETACNEETLEVLVQEGVKYVILEPHQADSVRKQGTEEWTSVGQGEIDPRRPYRCYLKEDASRFIDIFFYDGPISKSVGFEDLLHDAKIFMERINGAVVRDYPESQLIHIATDGETYGHHKAFGDRVLAYLLNVNAVQNNMRVINYGEYLEKHPSQWEVKIKEGENGEGTSWSCAHGVRRWRDDCGCRGDGPPEWHQKWRKPLRDALDWLRDHLSAIYERRAGQFLKEPWEARDAYIDVILDRSSESVNRFFTRHALRKLSREETTVCLKLLEAQRHAMLMYTSCGWFFTELSGIETVQVLQYAARAIQLTHEIGEDHFEEEFLKRLAQAPSNVDIYKDGRGIYEKLVKTAVGSLEQIVSFYAMGSVFEDYYPATTSQKLYCFDLDVQYQRKESFGTVTMNFGRVKITSDITLDEKEMIFIVVQVGTYDFRCNVMPFSDAESFEEIEKQMFDSLQGSHIVELFKKIDSVFGEKFIALKDLLLEDRMKIISRLTKKQIQGISRFYDRVYDESRPINEIYQSINLPIPAELRYAAEHVLSRRLMEELENLAEHGFPPRKAASTYRMMDTARSYQVEIDKKAISSYLEEALAERIEHLVGKPREELMMECIHILKIAEKMGISLDMRKSQDLLFFQVKQWITKPELIPAEIQSSSQQLTQLMGRLYLSTHQIKKCLEPMPSGPNSGPSTA